MQKTQYPLLIITVILLLGCTPGPSRRAVAAFDSVDPAGQEVSFYYQGGGELQSVWEGFFRRFFDTNPWGIRVIGENRMVDGEVWEGLLSQGKTGLVLFGQEAAIQEGAADLFPLYAHPRWGMKGVDPLAADLPFYLVKTSPWGLPYLPLLRDMDLLYINLDRGAVPGDPRMVWELPRLIFPPDARTQCAVFFSLGGEARSRKGAFLPGEDGWQSSRSSVEEAVARGLALPGKEKYSGQLQFSSGEAWASLDALSGLIYYEQTIEVFGSGFSWTLAPFPVEPQGGALAVWDLGIQILPGPPEAVLASWLFFLWCLEPANQAGLVAATGLLPLNRAALGYLSAFLGEHPPYRGIFDSYLGLPRRVFPRNSEGIAFFAQLNEEMASLGDSPRPR